jgi:hypothetical protein
VPQRPRRLSSFPRLAGWTFALLVTAGALGVAGPSAAFNRYLEMPEPARVEESKAHRYANLTNEEAFRELERRKVPFRKERGKVRGVRAPIRLTGALYGVHIHSTVPEAEWESTPYNILDARLALALHDLCRILENHDVVEIIHFTMYRMPDAKGDEPRFRHPGGLAIDVGAFRKRNGEWLSVGPHWPADIGAKTCGDGAKKLTTRRGRELMSIACEVYDQRIFHYTLGPHHDADHADHWHMEIKPGVKWFLVN